MKFLPAKIELTESEIKILREAQTIFNYLNDDSYLDVIQEKDEDKKNCLSCIDETFKDINYIIDLLIN